MVTLPVVSTAIYNILHGLIEVKKKEEMEVISNSDPTTDVARSSQTFENASETNVALP